MSTGCTNSLVEGTFIESQFIDDFSGKLVQSFLNNTQGEMGIVMQNISNFKCIFVKALKEYKVLNHRAIQDILTEHLKTQKMEQTNDSPQVE